MHYNGLNKDSMDTKEEIKQIAYDFTTSKGDCEKLENRILSLFGVKRSYSLDEVRNIVLEYSNASMYGHSHKLTRFELQEELRRIDEKYDLQYKEGIDYTLG